jgi:cyanate permease
MIQRLQSIFLLVVSLLSGFWGYQLMLNPLLEWQKFIVLFVSLSSFLNIFRYRNRVIQRNSCIVLIVLECIGGVGVLFVPSHQFVLDPLSLGLCTGTLFFTALAYVYIQKDIRYVKSMDSLR